MPCGHALTEIKSEQLLPSLVVLRHAKLARTKIACVTRLISLPKCNQVLDVRNMEELLSIPLRWGGGGEDTPMKEREMLVVSLRGVNFRF